MYVSNHEDSAPSDYTTTHIILVLLENNVQVVEENDNKEVYG